ncbi:MAG TPA: MBL fold metallo-hydrolase [Verrucomicrobiae bacterium]|jgi:L-ascorbate metabolism protein UlaG (beta-lactamase superfamily)|nr:MBL fold metallo-hydrolase [Verrucomicrobiae bacterium]
MIKPVLQNEQFTADVQRACAERDQFHLWWLGQSGFLLEWQGRHVLFDPYLSDSLTKKYAGTDKPHVRMTELVIEPRKLDFIDITTSSHNHTDHLDAETLIPLLDTNPKMDLVIPEANRLFVADRLKIVPELPIGLDAKRHTVVKGFNFHGVPAAHETVERDEQGRCKFLGYVVEFGEWTVYHSGDTVRYPEIADELKQWPIDVAILPINGAKPERRVAGNLSGREAAELARDIGARFVIPCHFEMFEFNTASSSEFTLAARQYGVSHRVLRAGERWSSRELPGK